VRQTVKEGLNLAQELAALPFRAARQLLRDTDMKQRPLGEVVADSLRIGEDLVRIPFKATAAIMDEMAPGSPSLEQRVAALERQLAPQEPQQPPVPTDPDPNPAPQ
jgi:hypothetical protein